MSEGGRYLTAYEIHPAANLFPMLNDDELLSLAENIKENGLIAPIVLFDGKILDGRNRMKACEIAGVDPRFIAWDGEGKSATLYVLSTNLHRRHLTVSQRAAIGAESIEMLHKEALRRQGRRTDLPTSVHDDTEVRGGSAAVAAAKVGVGSCSINRALAVKRDNPEAFQAMKRGETTANKEYAKLKNGLCSECSESAVTKGMCQKHYRRLRDTGSTKDPMSKAERIVRIEEMVGAGHNSEQIAEVVGVAAEHVRLLARESGIELPETAVIGGKKINITKIVMETVIAADHLTVGLDMVDGKLDQIEKGRIQEWIVSLDGSVRVLARLLKQLRKASENDN